MNAQLIYVKNTLKKNPLNVFSVSHMVNNYIEVIYLWNKFKKTNYYYDYTIRSLFNIHLEESDHIIMYYSKNQNEILLLCKQNNIYFNCKIPYMTFHCDKIEKMKNTNFVAIYK